MLTDPAGGSPTYDATSVDIGGILKITVSPKAETKKLPGDGKTLDTYTRITEVELDCEASLLSFDAYKLLIGGSVADSGTTPNQKATWSLTSATATPPWIKIEGQWLYAGDGLGDAHFILYKVKCTDPPPLDLADASGDFGRVKFKAIALAISGTAGSWYDIVLNETADAIE
jgi:hypothetical protein